MKKSFPLFYKLLISFIVCGIIPLIIISILIYGLSVRFINDMIYEQTRLNLTNMHQELNVILKDYEDIMITLQSDETIMNALSNDLTKNNENKIYEKIYDALKNRTGKPPLYILNTTGDVIFSTNPLPHIYETGIKNNWGIFREVTQGNDGTTTIYPQKINYEEGKSSLLSMGRKILDSKGNPIGYVIIDVYRDTIINIFRPHINGVPIHIVVLDDYDYTVLDIQNPNMEGKFQNATYLNHAKDIEFKGFFSELERDSYLTISYKDTYSKTTTIANVHSNIFHQLNGIVKTLLIIGCFISLLICCLISIVLAEHISNPMKQLIYIMSKVEKGDFSAYTSFNRNDEIGALGTYFNQMVLQLKKYLDRLMEEQNKLRVTEIKMLQAQINPHFLYNTLDVIKWSAKLNKTEEVTSIVTNLAKILRNSIDCEEEYVSVRKSIEFINSYLAIQKIKYNDKFDVNIDIDPSILELKTLRLILQPFIENAIIHGLTYIDHTGLITIIGEKDGDDIIFYIIDNGVGMTEDTIKRISKSTNDNHIGIYNVDKRIKLYYGDKYGVHIESIEEKGTKVTIKIPYLTGGDNQYD